MVNGPCAYKSGPVYNRSLIYNRYMDLYSSGVQVGQVVTVNSSDPCTHSSTHARAHTHTTGELSVSDGRTTQII